MSRSHSKFESKEKISKLTPNSTMAFNLAFGDHRMVKNHLVPMCDSASADSLARVCDKQLASIFKESARSAHQRWGKLINHVGMGEQNEAAAMLKADPSLALIKGQFTDPFGRSFTSISIFQYAFWARDRDMWEMILPYLSREEAARQLQELESRSTEYGRHFDFTQLKNALQFYVNNFDNWKKNNDNKARDDHWINEVGGAQRRGVTHIFNEYCRLDQAFNPCPNFDDKAMMPRSLKTDYPPLIALPLVAKKGVGFESALMRGGLGCCIESKRGPTMVAVAKLDLLAITALWKARMRDAELLIQNLNVIDHRQILAMHQEARILHNLMDNLMRQEEMEYSREKRLNWLRRYRGIDDKSFAGKARQQVTDKYITAIERDLLLIKQAEEKNNAHVYSRFFRPALATEYDDTRQVTMPILLQP